MKVFSDLIVNHVSLFYIRFAKSYELGEFN